MLTGRADKELVQSAAQFGVNNYLVKPFTAAVLEAEAGPDIRASWCDRKNAP